MIPVKSLHVRPAIAAAGGLSFLGACSGFTSSAADGASAVLTGDTRPTPIEQLDIRADEAADVCDPEARQVRVTVENIVAGGILTVEVFGPEPKDFLENEGRIRRARVPANNAPQTVCLGVDDAGPLAVAIYHDQNANRKIDKNFIGIPKEPFGLSNDPKLRLAKPKFVDSQFDISDVGVDLSMNLQRY